MTNITRREIETLTITFGHFVAEQLAPLKKENANLVEQIAGLKNEMTALRNQVEQKAAPEFRTRLKAVR